MLGAFALCFVAGCSSEPQTTETPPVVEAPKGDSVEDSVPPAPVDPGPAIAAAVATVETTAATCKKAYANLLFPPLPPGALEDLRKVRSDPAPDNLTKNLHYVVSNEFQHYVWREAISDSGGMMVGVGTDQLYVMAGWARPELLVPLDFDQYVIELHKIYGAMFKVADTPAEFLKLWSKKGTRTTKKALETHFPADSKKLWRMYAMHRQKIQDRLAWTMEKYAEEKVPMFLSDADQYGYIRDLWRDGRVFGVRGDLTKFETVTDISALSKKHALPVRVLYMSNAEYYFDFDADNFRKNMLELNTDDKSMILHTFPRNKEFYKYLHEPASVYKAWLKAGKVKNLRALVRKADKLKPRDSYTLKLPPE